MPPYPSELEEVGLTSDNHVTQNADVCKRVGDCSESMKHHQVGTA